MAVSNALIVATELHGEELFALFGDERRRITVASGTAAWPPGWTPGFIYAGFAPLYLLEFRHIDGLQSTWFLDDQLDRIAYDDPETVSGALATILRRGISRIATTLWDEVLASPAPELKTELAAFFALGPVVRRRLAALCRDESMIKVWHFDLSDIASPKTIRLGPELTVQTGRMTAALHRAWIEQATETLPEGVILWDSPVDDARIGTSSGLWLNDYLHMYRIIDHGTPFYAIVSCSKSRPIGFLFPARRMAFAQASFLATHFNNVLGVPMEHALIAHLFEYGDLVAAAWRSRTEGFSVVCRESFFGTQIWHDLTGLDVLVRRVPRDHLPEIIGWAGREIFGEIEELFPEITINRGIQSADALIRHCYGNRRCLLLLTDDHVTVALRERVLRANLREAAELNVELERVRQTGWPLVLLGLRVENRTLVDVPGFFAAVIEDLLFGRDGATVVLDGHNGARGDVTYGGTYGTPMEWGLTKTPLQVEHEIIASLRERFANVPVTIIDNIGAPVSHSVFWCHHADFFVTPYGTGLAKYRWVCNKVGLVVAGQWTLRHQEHLHIYEAPFIEAPAPLHFLPEQFVRDDPDAPVLVPYPGNPSDRANCHVDEAGLRHAIQSLLRATTPGGDARFAWDGAYL